MIPGGLKFIEDYEQFKRNEVKDTTPSNLEEYDFIIVGAGSAGATIVARLSAVEDVKVLLIEAGGHEILIMDIPAIPIYLSFDKDLNWGYLTESSNDYCLGTSSHQCAIPIGKVVGGSSTVNFMMAIRGSKFVKT